MKTSIHQPSYFPWLGLLDKIIKSDKFIILDNVQLADRAYQHRNLFLNSLGKEHLLTINISKKGYRDKHIKEILVSDLSWQIKHKKFLFHNYKKHPFFDDIYPQIKYMFENDYKFLIDVLIDSMYSTFKIFNIDTNIQLASEIYPDNRDIYKEDLILDLLKRTKSNSYLSGKGAKNYQKEQSFLDKNIILEYQNFIHPTYGQHNQKEFISGLSALDAAFNLGSQNTQTLLKDSR